METINELVRQYQRLIDLLEDEICSVPKCFQGDVLEAYQELLQREKNVLKQNLYEIKKWRL